MAHSSLRWWEQADRQRSSKEEALDAAGSGVPMQRLHVNMLAGA